VVAGCCASRVNMHHIGLEKREVSIADDIRPRLTRNSTKSQNGKCPTLVCVCVCLNCRTEQVQWRGAMRCGSMAGGRGRICFHLVREFVGVSIESRQHLCLSRINGSRSSCSPIFRVLILSLSPPSKLIAKSARGEWGKPNSELYNCTQVVAKVCSINR
jgi:hypothetical protein